MPYMIFQYGWQTVLIHRILISFEAILENTLKLCNNHLFLLIFKHHLYALWISTYCHSFLFYQEYGDKTMKKRQFLIVNVVWGKNGYIITLILHQIFIFSKWNLQRAKMTIPFPYIPFDILYPHPLFSLLEVPRDFFVL